MAGFTGMSCKSWTCHLSCSIPTVQGWPGLVPHCWWVPAAEAELAVTRCRLLRVCSSPAEQPAGIELHVAGSYRQHCVIRVCRRHLQSVTANAGPSTGKHEDATEHDGQLCCQLVCLLSSAARFA